MKMLREEQYEASAFGAFCLSRIRDYGQLMKPNLSFMVVFSSVIGYLMAPGVPFEWQACLLLFLGGMLVTNAANTINQIIERDSDKFMRRTQNRPLPSERMQPAEAWMLAALSAVGGVLLLGLCFNWYAASLSFLSLLLYAFAYTPLKKIHPIAVFVGAIPGALPPMIGWVAATGSVDMGAWVLFLIQFFWQFPHFWAIAWVAYDDYERAGIRMLPSHQGRTRFTGLQCMIYALMLVPVASMPYFMMMSGRISLFVCIAAGLGYLAASAHFYRKNDLPAARRVMFASFIYLPVVLLALCIDKF